MVVGWVVVVGLLVVVVVGTVVVVVGTVVVVVGTVVLVVVGGSVVVGGDGGIADSAGPGFDGISVSVVGGGAGGSDPTLGSLLSVGTVLGRWVGPSPGKFSAAQPARW